MVHKKPNSVPFSASSIRDEWITSAVEVIDAASPYLTRNHASYYLPGNASAAGKKVDGLEAFARIGLLKSFLVAGTDIPQRRSLIESLAQGMTAGTSELLPKHGWPNPSDYSQVIVEAASIALILRICGEELVDLLSDSTQARLARWLVNTLECKVHNNNWELFRLCISDTLVETFGWNRHATEIRDRVDRLLDRWYLGNGWYSDGPGRVIDYYNSYALHFYPVFSSYMTSNRYQYPKYRDRLREFTTEFSNWFGADGAPIAFGRSLTYRYGATASLSLAAHVGALETPERDMQELATNCRRFFELRNPTTRLLSPGWTEPNERIVQRYSGPASSYWISKAYICLLIPPGSDYWVSDVMDQPSAPQLCDPTDNRSRSAHLGFLVSAIPKTQTVTLFNHAIQDEISRNPNSAIEENPFYNHLGYSNQSLPLDRGPIREMSFTASNTMNYAIRGSVVQFKGEGNFIASTAQVRTVRRWLPARICGRSMSRIYNILPGLMRCRENRVSRMHLVTVAHKDAIIHGVCWLRLPFSGRIHFAGWPRRIPETMRHHDGAANYAADQGLHSISTTYGWSRSRVKTLTRETTENGQICVEELSTELIKRGTSHLAFVAMTHVNEERASLEGPRIRALGADVKAGYEIEWSDGHIDVLTFSDQCGFSIADRTDPSVDSARVLSESIDEPSRCEVDS